MIKNVIFDMDGVLIDTEALILDIWEQIARREGIAGIRGTLMQCIGITAPETEALFLRVYGKDFPYHKYRGMASEIFQAQVAKNGLPVKPGVYQLFDFLLENRYRIGLASSTREEAVRSHLERSGFGKYFKTVITGDMVEHSKPRPDIYLLACRELGVDPEEAYAIEDSPNGIRAAHAAGMRPVMVPDMIAPDDEMRKLSFLIRTDLFEVLDYLRKEGL